MPEEATQVLARFAAALTYDQLPDQVKEHCKNLLLDTLACALAGHQGEETQQVAALFLVDDAAPEASESLTVALSSPTQATLGAPATATITIVDDDQYRLYLPLVVKSTPSQGHQAGRIGH